MTNTSIRTAAGVVLEQRIRRGDVGHISTWDTSGVTPCRICFVQGSGYSHLGCNTAVMPLVQDIGRCGHPPAHDDVLDTREASAFTRTSPVRGRRRGAGSASRTQCASTSRYSASSCSGWAVQWATTSTRPEPSGSRTRRPPRQNTRHISTPPDVEGHVVGILCRILPRILTFTRRGVFYPRHQRLGHIEVTTMNNMFKEASSFNQPIGNWAAEQGRGARTPCSMTPVAPTSRLAAGQVKVYDRPTARYASAFSTRPRLGAWTPT